MGVGGKGVGCLGEGVHPDSTADGTGNCSPICGPKFHVVVSNTDFFNL